MEQVRTIPICKMETGLPAERQYGLQIRSRHFRDVSEVSKSDSVIVEKKVL